MARVMRIDIQAVSKSFETANGVTEALWQINLSVGCGEFVALLGPSGSGKSTLLEIVAGLIEATEGQVLVDGTRVTGPACDRAIVFQDYALFPWRTVVGNLRFVLEVQKVPRHDWDVRCRHYLEQVQLWPFRNSYPSELSGGMKQRVALVRALIGEPKILLMDEPFAALDAFTRHQLQRMLLRIVDEPERTVLFVTHSIDEAITLADRVAIITGRPGQLRAVVAVPGLPGARHLRSPQMLELQDWIWALLGAESG
jgi:NitT/TauT family transport system ATP-binding protein